MMHEKLSNLRFNGSVWCNLDVALRNIDQVFQRAVRPLGLTVIEWYILRALYEMDGQHASDLAAAVGRAATSFTPNLDKLQDKKLIERRPDPGDRRAVRIYLTDAGWTQQEAVLKVAEQVDNQIRHLLANGDFAAFEGALAVLQSFEPE